MELYEEHICQPIKNHEEIEDIFIKENIKSKNNLSITQTKLLNTERKIDELKTKINSLKLIIEKNKKIEYNNNDTIKEDTKEYISSSNNENNTQSKSQHNKKVNFTIDGKNNNSKIRNNCLCAKGCNYFNKLKLNKNNKIYNGSKIILMKKKKQKKRSSCPEIRIIQSIFGKKNNKLNNGKNYANNNKSINASDFDRTTKSTINDKIIEYENIFNKTL